MGQGACFHGGALEGSTAALKGAFSHQGTVAVTSPPAFAGQEAIVGTEFFDGYGAITGIGTRSLNGATFAYTDEQGTYNVNSDCTGI